MIELFTDGGLFQYLITLLGLLGLVFSILQILRKANSDYRSIIIGLLSATFFIALCGYSVGMHQAANVVSERTGDLCEFSMKAEGIANSVLALAGLLCGINAIVGSIACHVYSKSKASTS